MEFPAEWDKEERMKAGDTDIEAVTKRKKKSAGDRCALGRKC